ncbi:endonuclease MutS2 [Helicobacter sp. 23-1044]
MNDAIIKKLDLWDFIKDFLGFFARKNNLDSALNSQNLQNLSHKSQNLTQNPQNLSYESQNLIKSLKIKGDLKEAKLKIDELSSIVFAPPQSVVGEIRALDNELAILKKGAILKLDSLFEFAKIIKYFLYLKNLNLDSLTQIPRMLGQINIPFDILQIVDCFENDGNLRSGKYEKFDFINQSIKNANKELKKQLDRLLGNAKITPYLVDKSVHFIDGRECLLVRSGFSKVMQGRIMQRTQAGFFYILPNALQYIYDKLDKLRNEREIALFEIEREISSKMQENIFFLKFINAEFDRFDALQSRVFFAKTRNFEFILPTLNRQKYGGAIVLSDFCHPNIKNPIPCNVEFDRQIMLVTGVNAGGKTMLLKSILSASLLSNLLIPFKISPHKSKIPHFARIEAILNDPQDSKNDISTFAGRMMEFSAILAQIRAQGADSNIMLGIDEIELGTDANEASALYFALLEHLSDKNIKIIITTHHKILASKMADNPRVELLAALYDEANRAPTYTFLKGTIGKSYAFESALKYGIPRFIIEKAQKIYNQNLENLNALLEQTSTLKANLIAKEAQMEANLQKIERKKDELDLLIEAQNNALGAKKAELESIYNKALDELKAVLKKQDSKEIHRFLNAQHKAFRAIPKDTPKRHIDFKVGNRVTQGKNIGIILSIKGENAQIELENGVRVRTKLSALKLAPQIPQKARSVSVSKVAKSCPVCLDLHGKRAEEALDLLEAYISDCLMAGFELVLIKHGIGSGVLSAVVRDFLSAHPKVQSFEDAPPQMGGFGAKIVRF